MSVGKCCSAGTCCRGSSSYHHRGRKTRQRKEKQRQDKTRQDKKRREKKRLYISPSLSTTTVECAQIYLTSSKPSITLVVGSTRTTVFTYKTNLQTSRHGAQPYKFMGSSVWSLCGYHVRKAVGTQRSRDPEAVLMYSGLHTL